MRWRKCGRYASSMGNEVPRAMTVPPSSQDRPMHHAWCLEQVVSWLSRTMSHREALARFRHLNASNAGVFLLTIQRGTVVLEEKPEHARSELYDFALSRALLYRSF